MVILASYQDKLGDVVKLPVSCSGQGDGDFLASLRVVHLNHRAPAVFRLKDRHFIISQGIKELPYEVPVMRPLVTSVKIRSSRMPWWASRRSCVSRFLASSSDLLTRA